MRKEIEKSIISSLSIGSTVFLVFFLIRGGFSHPTPTLWSDGFIVVGMLLLLYAFFRRISRTGLFDWPSYLIYTMKHFLDRSAAGFLNYYDYKSTLEYETRPLWGIAITGCTFLTVGIAISVCH